MNYTEEQHRLNHTGEWGPAEGCRWCDLEARRQQDRELDFVLLTLAHEGLRQLAPKGVEWDAWYPTIADLDARIRSRRWSENMESIEAGFGDLYEADNGPLSRAYRLLGIGQESAR